MIQEWALLCYLAGLLAIVVAMAVLIGTLGRVQTTTNTAADHERRRLYFAAVVLTGLGIIFLEAMGFYYFTPAGSNSDAAEKIFEKCVTIIPPIVTLVLGYYFGRAEPRPTSEENSLRAGPPSANERSGAPPP